MKILGHSTQILRASVIFISFDLEKSRQFFAAVDVPVSNYGRDALEVTFSKVPWIGVLSIARLGAARSTALLTSFSFRAPAVVARFAIVSFEKRNL
jgi:hypothetical protein